jgi:hypothetical protein
MFYNLESAVSFVEDVTGLLSDDGIWHFEQSYILSMLRTNSYGTVRHEHLEFYSFTLVENLLEASGLRVGDASFRSNSPMMEWMLRQEQGLCLDTPRYYPASDDTFEAVIGTGEAHSLAHWMELCFGHLKLDWRSRVRAIDGVHPAYETLVSDPTTIFSLGLVSRTLDWGIG